MNLAGKGPTHEACGDLPGFDEGIEMDPRFDAHTVQHGHKILGGQIAWRARRQRGTGESTQRV